MRATRYDRYRCAQNADHFAHNSPFSAFFAEVVCTLGMTPPRTVISPPPEGGLHDQYGGHRKTCWARLWTPWAAVPVGGAGPGRASRRRTQPHTATQAPPVWKVRRARLRCPWAERSLAGLRDDAPSHTQRHKRRRCGRSGGPGCGARGRSGAWPGFETTHQSASATGHHWVERPDTQAAVPVGGAEPGRASHSDTSAAGVEGPEGQAAVPVGGAGPGQASRRRAQPRTATQAPPVWRVPEGPEGQGGLRDRPLRAVGSRVAISRAAGPDGTRNTSGAQNTINIPQHAHAPTRHSGITKPPGPIGAGRQWR